MDLSKLPKLSQTPSQTEQPAPEQSPAQEPDFCKQCGLPLRKGARFCDACGSPTGALDYGTQRPAPGTAADAWISIALGVILLFIGPRLIQYLLSPSTFPQKWSFSDPTGAPLAYTQTVFFWGDIALTSFALVLIVEGIALMLGRRAWVVGGAFVLTTSVTFLNLIYVIVMMQKGYGA